MQDFIDDYLKRGFGSMNKNDFEVMIMHELLQGKLKGKSNYEISRELRIPETRVKRLIYEASLKYVSGDEPLRERLMSALKKVHVYEEGNQMMFFVEDVASRKYLESLLKDDGRFAKYELNSEIISVQREDFVYLLDKLYSSEDKARISNQICEILKVKVPDNEQLKTLEKMTFADHMKDLLNRFVDKSKDKVVDLTVEGILKLLFKMLSLALI